ncbi:MAG: CPBP family glutamic-type intramembrane protease [Thermoguttaceae bacterium]
MNDSSQDGLSAAHIAIVFLAISACLTVWAAIFERRRVKKSLVEYQPRRQVPWQIGDQLAILLFYLLGLYMVFFLLRSFLPDFGLDTSSLAVAQEKSTIHPLLQLLKAGDWKLVFVCVVVAIIVAPLSEEMFFRVLFQGWLEKKERHWRCSFPILRRWAPLGAMPIFCSASVFAWLHYRSEAPLPDIEYLMFFFIGDAMLKLLTMFFAVALVHFRVGAAAIDLGWSAQKFLADVKLGLVAFVAIAAPLYFGQYMLSQFLPKQFAPDPVALFFLAIVLGYLYHRTHRITPSIVVHMLLNASSLTMFFLWKAG